MIGRKKIQEAKPEEAALQLVTFRIGAEEYGVEIPAVSEVIRPIKITPLPRMPQFIEGVINLRGSIIPVVDLRKRFSVEPTGTPRTVRILIIRGAVTNNLQDLLGIIVDSVRDVYSFPARDISAPPDAAVGPNAELIRGIGKTPERLVILLEITKILSQQERTELAEVQIAAAETMLNNVNQETDERTGN